MTRFCVLFFVGLALSGFRLVLPVGADTLPSSEAAGAVTMGQMQIALPDPPRIVPRPRPGDGGGAARGSGGGAGGRGRQCVAESERCRELRGQGGGCAA